MERRTFLVTAGSALTVGVAGCLDAGADPTGENEVGMTIDSFRPDELTVEAGTTVEFINTSSHAHTVTAFQDAYPERAKYWASGGFDSEQGAIEAWENDGGGALFQGESYERTFDVPGVYQYYCVPHIEADMVGEVVVEEDRQ